MQCSVKKISATVFLSNFFIRIIAEFMEVQPAYDDWKLKQKGTGGGIRPVNITSFDPDQATGSNELIAAVNEFKQKFGEVYKEPVVAGAPDSISVSDVGSETGLLIDKMNAVLAGRDALRKQWAKFVNRRLEAAKIDASAHVPSISELSSETDDEWPRPFTELMRMEGELQQVQQSFENWIKAFNEAEGKVKQHRTEAEGKQKAVEKQIEDVLEKGEKRVQEEQSALATRLRTKKDDGKRRLKQLKGEHSYIWGKSTEISEYAAVPGKVLQHLFMMPTIRNTDGSVKFVIKAVNAAGKQT